MARRCPAGQMGSLISPKYIINLELMTKLQTRQRRRRWRRKCCPGRLCDCWVLMITRWSLLMMSRHWCIINARAGLSKKRLLVLQWLTITNWHHHDEYLTSSDYLVTRSARQIAPTMDVAVWAGPTSKWAWVSGFYSFWLAPPAGSGYLIVCSKGSVIKSFSTPLFP